jgi:hypothetical protein
MRLTHISLPDHFVAVHRRDVSDLRLVFLDIGVPTDLDHPELAPLNRCPQRRQPHDLRVRCGDLLQFGRERLVGVVRRGDGLGSGRRECRLGVGGFVGERTQVEPQPVKLLDLFGDHVYARPGSVDTVHVNVEIMEERQVGEAIPQLEAYRKHRARFAAARRHGGMRPRERKRGGEGRGLHDPDEAVPHAGRYTSIAAMAPEKRSRPKTIRPVISP